MMKMIKTLALATALLIGATPTGALASVAQEASVSTGNAASVQTSTVQPADESGLKMELLWCAKAGTYDTTDAEDLTPHTPEVLETGNVYEVAIKVTNDTEDEIAIPWGVEYAIVLPRVLTPEMSEAAICSVVHSARRNGGTSSLSEIMTANIRSEEPVALRYVDFSNYTTYPGETTRTGFNWAADSNPLDDEKIFLQGTWQGFQPDTYKIVSFMVEVCPFAEWEEFADIMHRKPVRAIISSVTEGMRWERCGSDNTVYCKEIMDIDFTVNIPQWLRDLTAKEGGWWRIMVQPRFGTHGTVGVELRFENHNCSYVLAADQVWSQECDTDRWMEYGYFVGATFDECETYARAENWGDHGADYRWASLKEEHWDDLLLQDELHITLELEMK